MRILWPNTTTSTGKDNKEDETMTAFLQDHLTLEQQQVKNQAVLHLIFAKPIMSSSSKEREFGVDDDAIEEDHDDDDDELEWEEPNNVLSYSLQQETKPKE